MSNEKLTSCQRLSIAEQRTASRCQTVKMPRQDGGQGLRRLCNHGRGTLGTAMSNGREDRPRKPNRPGSKLNEK
jgi:hypothetical protein